MSMIKRSACISISGTNPTTIASNDQGVTIGNPALDTDIIFLTNTSTQEAILDVSYGTGIDGIANGAAASIWVYITNLSLPRTEVDRIYQKLLTSLTAYSSWVELGKLVIPASHSLVIRLQSISPNNASGKVYFLAQGYQNTVGDPII